MSCAVSGACASTGPVGSTLSAALHFFAAAQCLLQEPWPPHTNVRNESCFDFIIAGGGTAGVTLAARLAQDGSSRVLLVEAGGDPPPESIIPAFAPTMVGSESDWQFTSVNDGYSSQGLAGGRQAYPSGRMLGGTGALNDLVYARGFPADYDHWADTLGDDTWKWVNVLPYFKKTEHLTDEKIINDPQLMKLHGRGGDIEVAGFNVSSFSTNMFLKAFKELGFAMVKDMTSPTVIGAGRHSHTIRDGRRDNSLMTVLNNQVKNKNLFVLKDTLVTKILIENNTAYGVKVLSGDTERHFYAKKEVIVTAGTFNTPKLLMLSGIGPKDHLEDLGIEVVADLPVGDNLHDHAMVIQYFTADNGTCYADQTTDYMNMVRYLYDHSGPLSVVNHAAAYMALPGSLQPNLPDFAFYPSCMTMNTDFYDSCISYLRFNKQICSQLQNLLKDKELITVAAVLLAPESRGHVRLRSTNPLVAPLIYSGAFSNRTDLQGYPTAIQMARNITNTTYFARKNTTIVDLDLPMCEKLEGEEAVKCRAQAVAMTAWHSVGTCAMGAALDSRLRVRGVAGLRVADASAMPRVVRGNVNAPVVMIAEKAADFIKEDYGCTQRNNTAKEELKQDIPT